MPPLSAPRPLLVGFALVVSTGLAVGAALVGTGSTTAQDFIQPGTQPGALTDVIQDSGSCAACHGMYDPDLAPLDTWAPTMMAQAARDPMFWACMAIAEQDAPASGETCIRCHSPKGWLEGDSSASDGSALSGTDFDGVTCHVCHRMVDPVFDALENPAVDQGILASLAMPPTAEVHNGGFVIDPLDRRRGPYDLGVGFPWHDWRQSPFHQDSMLCGTCHDVSNPAFDRVGGATPAAADSYAFNADDTPHPTQNKYDQYPIERTYSEWLLSDFAQGPIDLEGRFGGNITEVSSCQDCHMPDITGSACAPGFGGVLREDLPQHTFLGANTWVPDAIYELDQSLDLYGSDAISGVPQFLFDDVIARNKAFLSKAADMELTQVDEQLQVRIVNQTGHKLPTGYGEGRRMWVNVQFFDSSGGLLSEHGHYDFATADLTTADTKVYEHVAGIDAAQSAATGLPQGKSFHFVLNNTVIKDNRIPPRGFDNAAFEAVQANPVAYSYGNGEHWDDTLFEIPCGSETATVTFYGQTTSKEYVEFLRDENTTNNHGQIAYDLWEQFGKSEPHPMNTLTIDLAPHTQSDIESISLAAGGTQTVCINAGTANAGNLYLTAGSVSGTFPGLPLTGGLTVPLNFDFYFQFTVTNANSPTLPGSFGALDAQGQSTMQLVLGPNAPASLAGLTVHHAFAVLTPALNVVDVSTAVPLQLLP